MIGPLGSLKWLKVWQYSQETFYTPETMSQRPNYVEALQEDIFSFSFSFLLKLSAFRPTEEHDGKHFFFSLFTFLGILKWHKFLKLGKPWSGKKSALSVFVRSDTDEAANKVCERTQAKHYSQPVLTGQQEKRGHPGHACSTSGWEARERSQQPTNRSFSWGSDHSQAGFLLGLLTGRFGAGRHTFYGVTVRLKVVTAHSYAVGWARKLHLHVT